MHARKAVLPATRCRRAKECRSWHAAQGPIPRIQSACPWTARAASRGNAGPKMAARDAATHFKTTGEIIPP